MTPDAAASCLLTSHYKSSPQVTWLWAAWNTHSGILEIIPQDTEVSPSLMVSTGDPVFSRPTTISSTISPMKKGVACVHTHTHRIMIQHCCKLWKQDSFKATVDFRGMCWAWIFVLADELKACRTFMSCDLGCLFHCNWSKTTMLWQTVDHKHSSEKSCAGVCANKPQHVTGLSGCWLKERQSR